MKTNEYSKMHPDFVLLQRLIKRVLNFLDKMEKELKGADENSCLEYFCGYARSRKDRAEFECNFLNWESQSFFNMFYVICKKILDIFGSRFLSSSLSNYSRIIIHDILESKRMFMVEGVDLMKGEIPEDVIKSKRAFGLWCVGIFRELITEMKKNFDEFVAVIYSDED